MTLLPCPFCGAAEFILGQENMWHLESTGCVLDGMWFNPSAWNIRLAPAATAHSYGNGYCDWCGAKECCPGVPAHRIIRHMSPAKARKGKG